MKQWFTFSEAEDADLFAASSYSHPVTVKPACNGNSKICAIYAADNGHGNPIIERESFAKDFIMAMQTGQDYGMVALNNKYKKKKHWYTSAIDRLLKIF